MKNAIQRSLRVVSMALLTLASGHSFAGVINFDSLTPGEVVTNQFVSQGVLISSTFGPVTVSTAAADTAPYSLNGGNFQEVIVDFVNPADGVTPWVTDFFQMTLGDVDIPGNGMTAYDIDGVQIGQVISSCAADFACPGSNLFETLSLSIAGMSRIVIAAGGQIVDGTAQGEATVDTFVFNDVTAPRANGGGNGGGNPVPVPGTLLLIGMGLFSLRRISRRVA